MTSTLDLIHGLTDPHISVGDKRGLANEFSREFGWRPNDFIDTLSPLTATNIVVEQGLENAALLSFLPSNRSIDDLPESDKRSILSLSYNSLVDWHIWIDNHSAQYVYNRTFPPLHIPKTSFNYSDYSSLKREVFDQAVEQAPNPNVLALDGALLETIRNWKQILQSEIRGDVSNVSISALFNAIILARAIEDFDARTFQIETERDTRDLRGLVEESSTGISDALEHAITRGGNHKASELIFPKESLRKFDEMSRESSLALVEAFYQHPAVPYDYDFSVISKRALSKIYERYMAVLQSEDAVQFSMFPATPEDSWNKHLGGVYTPQYIASFFARYLEKHVTPKRFLDSSVADPACGSGIFLRATMERKLLAYESDLGEAADAALDLLFGADVDENAVAASRLSLALLYLAARGELPSDVPIRHVDSLDWFAPAGSTQRQFDVVMANPPFLRTELQPEAVRRAVADHVGFAVKGKLDAYLAFIALSIRALKPGGFGFFVVPNPLLTSDNLKPLRDWILGEAWIRVIADLSAIPVFKANVYVALLIVQRKEGETLPAPPVALIRCDSDVGAALEDFLDGKHRRTSSYFIFEAPQSTLDRPTWSVHTPEETSLLGKMEALPPLSQLAEVRQGVITGADSVFVIDSEEVPLGEGTLYRPFLPDRLIGRYTLPAETGNHIFYPFIDNDMVSESRVELEFPETWRWLEHHRDKLTSRAPVARGSVEWWQPAWPRAPHVLKPKIVMPEVALIPRFGVDKGGEWIVGHSPFISLSGDTRDDDMLLVLAALMNSSVVGWFIDMNARKLRSGYNKLSISLIRRIPVPNLNDISLAKIRRIVELTRSVVSQSSEFNYEMIAELDGLVSQDLYRLSESEIDLITP